MNIITKTTITFTVLHRSDQPIDSLGEAIDRADDGHAVGTETSFEIEEIDDGDVEHQLSLLGNDGSFFDGDLNPESEEDA